MPAVGEMAPDFDLPDQNQVHHRLSDYQGQWLVIYFYPKDETPGCTKEACAFRDASAGLGAAVIGISKDSVESHAKFAQNHQLNFPLLADPETQVIRAYGAWGTKNLYGKVSEGTLRQTFLIDPEGKIAHIWKKVKPETHPAEVAAKLEALA
jgi:peroxiredoxin Q/BCP